MAKKQTAAQKHEALVKKYAPSVANILGTRISGLSTSPVATSTAAAERHLALKAKSGNTKEWADMEKAKKNTMSISGKGLFPKHKYTEQQLLDARLSSDAQARLKAYGPAGKLDSEMAALFAKGPKVSRTARSVSAPNLGKAQANKALAKQLTKQSFLLEIQGLQLAKDSLLSAAKNNALKQQYELAVSLEDAARQYSAISSAQRAAAGASGLVVHSQSFLDVYAEAANQYTIQTNRLKEVTALNQEALYKEALMKAEEYNIEINSVGVQQRLQNLMIDDN